jgi:hypothetical protein
MVEGQFIVDESRQLMAVDVKRSRGAGKLVKERAVCGILFAQDAQNTARANVIFLDVFRYRVKLEVKEGRNGTACDIVNNLGDG